MARVNELTVDVSARLTVDDETVRRCLALVEMWLNDHPDAHIYGEKEGERTVLRIRKEAAHG